MSATATVPAPTGDALPAVAEFAGYTMRRAGDLAQRDLPADLREALQDIARRATMLHEATRVTIGERGAA